MVSDERPRFYQRFELVVVVVGDEKGSQETEQQECNTGYCSGEYSLFYVLDLQSIKEKKMIVEGVELTEEFRGFIKRNIEPSDRSVAMEGTGVTSIETVNRLLRGTQAITEGNKPVVMNLFKIAVRNSYRNEVQDRTERENFLAESDMSNEEFLSEVRAYETN